MPNANTQAEKKWYLFDEHDCFNNYHIEQGAQAMEAAVAMEREGFDGVHVVCMTQAQFDAYCKHGNLKKAMEA